MNSIEIWKEIFHLSEELYIQAPWTYMAETDIFGVRTPGSGKTYFISIMGSAGELSALAAYEGSNALEQFWEIQENPNGNPENILLIPHIILSYVNKNEIDRVQTEIFKEAGFKGGRGRKWPDVKRVIPGLVPSVPGDSCLEDLANILEQSLEVFSRAQEDLTFILPEDQDDDVYLVREQTKKGRKTEWKDIYRKVRSQPLRYNPVVNLSNFSTIQSLPKTTVILQAGLRMIPNHIRDKINPDHFPFMVILTDKKSGLVEGFELLTPFPDYNSMLEKIPVTIIGLINKLKFRPMRIEVNEEKLFVMLDPIFRKIQINIKLVPVVKSVEEAFEGILNHMG